MTDKIDEIVEKVLPEDYNWCEYGHSAWITCKDNLKQAILRGELCVPLSVEEITKIMDEYDRVRNYPVTYKELARSIHYRLTGRGE